MDTNPGLHQILTDLSAAHVALRRSSIAFDTAMAEMRSAGDGIVAAVAGMRGAIDAIGAANQAQGDVIDSVVAATEQALRLFTAPERH